MLRGRRSCTISERPTTLPTPKNPLSPLFPLDTGHSPVTPLFPLHTRKRGVHPLSNIPNRSISEFFQPRSSRAPFVPLFPLRSSAYSAPPRYLRSSLFSETVDCKLSAVNSIFPYFPHASPPISFLFCRFLNSYRKNRGVPPL